MLRQVLKRNFPGFLLLLSLTSIQAQTASAVVAGPRRQSFKFELTAVDAKTGKPRSVFYLGETVAVRISLTNQSRTARTIVQLPDTSIGLRLSSMLDYENGPDIIDSYIGGTGTSSYVDGIWSWGDRPARTMTIAPGQTVSRTIDDVGRHFLYSPLQEGSHTLTAKYNSSLRATVSFRVVVDEAKTIPLLEALATSAPSANGDDSVQRGANIVLNWVRQPSITGHVRDTNGQPLKDVEIAVTGTQKMDLETRNDGSYRASLLSENGTYTITPSIPAYGTPGLAHYTFEPASRTISIMNGKITNADFTGTRIRASTNVALADEGAKATASSIRDDDFETENVINGFRKVDGWTTGSAGWNDGTPNKFPDWLEVNFGRTRRINWINVFTVPDNYKDPADPELNQTFSHYGITDFDVQYWTGRAWRTVPGGAIRGNRNVWRMISFPVVTTDKIRVVVRSAMGGESRIAEIEAWHLNDLPQAKIAVEGTSNIARGLTNSAVHFSTEVFDRDGTIRNYELDFGDKSGLYEWSFNGEKPGDRPKLTHSYIYEKEGIYKVTLRVVDDLNEASETTLVLTITDPLEKKSGRRASLTDGLVHLPIGIHRSRLFGSR